MKKIGLIFICALMSFFSAQAEFTIDYSAELIGNAGSGNFAPHYIASNVHGVITQSNSCLLKLDLHRDLDLSKRFSWGFGASTVDGFASATDYSVYDVENKELTTRAVRPEMFVRQELYLDLKYRSIFLTLGAKELNSKMLNSRLSSGDLTISSNARPVPGIRAGFVDPQNIPFTNGWVQISGEIGYYRQTDNDWIRNHYNYYNHAITVNHWLNYKYCYLNTNPDKAFSFTLGLQASCQFGGEIHYYNKGELTSTIDMSPTLGTFFRTMVPGGGGNVQGDQLFVEGNHLGSIDLMGRYRFKKGTELKLYFQNPWEDGSGLGKMNGFDGLYGIEYKSASSKGIVTGAVVEWLEMMNQGGSVIYVPQDWEDLGIENQIQTPATGGDNYYNNYCYYSGYSNYGMSYGSPLVKSPLYNLDGHLKYTDNRMRAIHAAIEGRPFNNWAYRIMFSYTKSKGTIGVPITTPRENYSGMLECIYNWKNVPGLDIKAQIGFDKGELYGNNFGALLSVSYSGLLKL